MSNNREKFFVGISIYNCIFYWFIKGSILQVPLTGTALPVLLSLSPQSKYDFNQCAVGERIEALGILHNDSTCMPITYQFRRIAQYSVKPPNGKIKPGNKQEIVIAFSPNQVGE